jgi:ADP-heptose:LPS heptosyltransferase
MQAAPRVAVYVDLDLVGDALIKLPMVRALRHAFPTGELIWIAGRGRSAYASALAPIMPGLLDQVIENGFDGDGLASKLNGPLDLLIDTQARLRTSLALRRLRPRRFLSPAAGYLLSSFPPRPFYRRPRWLIRWLLDLVERATGAPAVTDGTLVLPPAAEALAAALLPAGPPALALVVGAGGRHKAWPLERHVTLARALLARGQRPVLILGPDEEPLHGELAAALPEALFPRQQVTHAAGPELTIALGRRCAAAVAGDCGGGHMLAASGTRMVSLFGPTNPGKFAPWASQLTILRQPTMHDITVDSVLAALGRAA